MGCQWWKLECIIHQWRFRVHSMRGFSFGFGLKSHGLVSTVYGNHDFFPFNLPNGARNTRPLCWGKLFRGNRCKKMEAWFFFQNTTANWSWLWHGRRNDETGYSWRVSDTAATHMGSCLDCFSPTESLEKMIQIKAASYIFLLLASLWGSSMFLTPARPIMADHPDFI